MSDQYLNKTGLTRLWSKIKANQTAALRPLFESEIFGPSDMVSFEAEANGLPLKSCKIDIESAQSGSGNPSPTNIRAISGWTGANLSVSPTTVEGDGTICAISFPSAAGTVYGGTLDVLTGLLTVTHVGYTFDGTESWGAQYSGANQLFRFVATDTQLKLDSSRMCSHFQNASVISSTTSIGYYAYTSSGNSSGWIQIRPGISGITTVTQWKNWLAEQDNAGTPMTCVAPLINPVTYQLTPHHVKTLAGQNNIWADTGNVTVEYGAFLQTLQQEIEILEKSNEA